jgi:hypothetical protein
MLLRVGSVEVVGATMLLHSLKILLLLLLMMMMMMTVMMLGGLLLSPRAWPAPWDRFLPWTLTQGWLTMTAIIIFIDESSGAPDGFIWGLTCFTPAMQGLGGLAWWVRKRRGPIVLF